jgi:hypothetical protein
MSKKLSNVLKFATTASAISLVAACGDNNNSTSQQAQAPQAPQAQTVPLSDAYKSADECGHKQIDNALKLAGKTKDELSVTEYEDRLREATDDCKAAYDSALAQHQTSRPRYADSSDCNRVARCETIYVDNRPYYSPIFEYFMMSQILNNSYNNNRYDHYNDGYQNGRNSGYNNGHNDGYEAGRRDAQQRAARQAELDRARTESAPVYKNPNKDAYVSPSGQAFNSTTIREAGKDAFAKPATPPPVVSKGGEYATKPYTPPASVTYNAPTRVPVAPAPRNTDAYKPSTSSNAGSTSRATPPSAPPAARPSTPPPSAPAYRSPSPAPSAPAYRSSTSPSYGGGSRGSSGGFGGGSSGR